MQVLTDFVRLFYFLCVTFLMLAFTVLYFFLFFFDGKFFNIENVCRFALH